MIDYSNVLPVLALLLWLLPLFALANSLELFVVLLASLKILKSCLWKTAEIPSNYTSTVSSENTFVIFTINPFESITLLPLIDVVFAFV